MINKDLPEGFYLKLIADLFRAKVTFCLVFITFLIVFHYFKLLRIETTPIIIVFILEMGVFFLYFLIRERKPEWAIQYNIFSLWLDVVAITVILHCLGGVYAIIIVGFYYIFIAVTSIYLSKKGRLSYYLYIVTIYSLICIMESKGIIPRNNIFNFPVSRRLDFICWFGAISVMSLTALIASNYIEIISRFQRFANLGRLSTELAHEIRTPLQVIEGTTHAKEFTEDSKKVIRAQVERIARYVKEILALAREEKQKTSTARLEDIVDYSANLVHQALAIEKKVDLEKKYCAEELWVHVDIDQVTKAISNLVRNGIDSIKGQGQLSIIVSRYGFEWGQVEICDTGVGMHRSELKKIFEPFYTTKTGMRGVGLGLAISKKFIEANGGGIEVASEEGKGSRFIVKLPLYDKDE